MRIGILGARRRLQDGHHQVLVPASLVPTILQAYHDSPLAGHLAWEKTYERIMRRYWWPSIRENVMKHVRACVEFGRRRTSHRTRRSTVGARPPVWAPFQRASMDFMKLPRGHDHLLVFTDSLTRWVEAMPTRGEESSTVAGAIYDEVVTRYGCPQELMSDRGPSFISQVTRELTRIMGVHKSFVTAYHAPANGQSSASTRPFNVCCPCM